MSSKILTRVYTNLPVIEKEILRYAGVTSPSEEVLSLLSDVEREALPLIQNKVCYLEFDVKWAEDALELGFCLTESRALMKNLSGCEKIILFAATVGGGLDRLMAKYEVTSPTKALLLQALGAERIESLADAFSADMQAEAMAKGCTAVPRFSPGYGDLPLSLQKDIFRVLDCPRKIGLTLSESLLMSPTKSITAIIGLKDNENH